MEKANANQSSPEKTGGVSTYEKPESFANQLRGKWECEKMATLTETKHCPHFELQPVIEARK